MSPRSEELLALARRRLAQARLDLSGGFPDGSVSAAYYAMLSAARAALSERDRAAKTHSGTWGAFRELFVLGEGFPADLFAEGPRTQNLRWIADYEAEEFSAADAQAVVDAAERFVDAVEQRISRAS